MNIPDIYLFFGIDEIEFTFENGNLKNNVFFDFQENLDDDNSSYAYLELEGFNIKFHYSKIYPKGYEYGLKFSTVIQDNIIDCFAILKGRKGKIVTSKDKIVFYSSFFILQNLGKLPFSLYDFMLLFGKPKLHRLDIALDLPLDIETINKTIFKDVNFFAQIGRDKKNETFSQTYYIGNPRSDRNRKYIFRVYDKILDTVKKQKAFLYPHLVNQDNVRRIELELRAEECARIIEYDVYDILQNKNNCVSSIFSKFFNKNSSIKIKSEPILFTLYNNKNINLKNIYLETKQIPKDYMARASGYIKNIINNTSYNGLFDVIIKNTENNQNKIKNLENLFSEMCDYVIKSNIRKSKIKNILKKFDKIKL